MVTEVREVQLAKTKEQIEVRVSGREIEVREVHSEKA